MKTSAIATVLDATLTPGNSEVWKVVERIRSESGIETFGILHFSWHVAERYDISQVKIILEEISGIIQPFRISSSGLGIFTGDRPVLYLPVVKTQWISKLHADIWHAIAPAAECASQMYSPQDWLPHITLVVEESHPELVFLAAKQLMSEPLRMDLLVNHLGLIYRNDNAQGLLFNIPFGGRA